MCADARFCAHRARAWCDKKGSRKKPGSGFIVILFLARLTKNGMPRAAHEPVARGHAVHASRAKNFYRAALHAIE